MTTCHLIRNNLHPLNMCIFEVDIEKKQKIRICCVSVLMFFTNKKIYMNFSFEWKTGYDFAINFISINILIFSFVIFFSPNFWCMINWCSLQVSTFQFLCKLWHWNKTAVRHSNICCEYLWPSIHNMIALNCQCRVDLNGNFIPKTPRESFNVAKLW